MPGPVQPSPCRKTRRLRADGQESEPVLAAFELSKAQGSEPGFSRGPLSSAAKRGCPYRPRVQVVLPQGQVGEKPGYPRFRPATRCDSFTYPQSGFRVDDKRVFLSKIGHVKAVVHRPLEGTVKTATVRKSATGKWFVCLSREVESEPLPESDEAVGVDVGLKDIIATSDGGSVPAPKFLRKEEKELARTQRKFSEAPRGGRERAKRRKAVAKVHERIKNKRSNFAHQESRKLVNRYGFIAVEDLSVNRMNKNHCLAKSIADAAWTDLARKIAYKAANAGREFVKVAPHYTSQDCSCCGYRQVMPLSVRVYDCPECGLSLDRDVNAAKNILRLGEQSQRGSPQEARAL
ncbi:MAG: RNA-guided endonuclease InsQ/TnpB family protein [Gammaproteobacteria bacterium]